MQSAICGKETLETGRKVRRGREKRDSLMSRIFVNVAGEYGAFIIKRFHEVRTGRFMNENDPR